ncbi:MAG: alkaline phosphatase [Armatimonadota bacterium]
MFARRFVKKFCLALLLVGWLFVPGTELSARRIILMIGDGMGFKHVEMTRNYVGSPLAMEMLPVRYGCTTYEYGGGYSSLRAWSDFNYVKSGATDSASAATALSCGVKTDNGNIATSHNDVYRLETMTEYARQLGLVSGVVSTVPFSHATPAAFVAHNNHRNNYTAIAREMITSFGDGIGARGNTPTIEVIIGGGHPSWAGGYIGVNEYNALKNGTTGQGWTFVERRPGVHGFVSLASAATSATKLFGLFGGSGGNIEYRNAYGTGANPENPTLAEMSIAALNVLERHETGFFLMIEGGAIDWASHSNNVNQMLGEMIGFDQAVLAVLGWVSSVDPMWSNTLLIVTGDHETGYITRGAGVFPDISLANPGAGVLPTAGVHFAWNSTGHTNSLVPVFAKGVGSHLFAQYARNWDAGYDVYYLDNTEINTIIRLVAVPEPCSACGVMLGAVCLVRRWRKVRTLRRE